MDCDEKKFPAPPAKALVGLNHCCMDSDDSSQTRPTDATAVSVTNTTETTAEITKSPKEPLKTPQQAVVHTTVHNNISADSFATDLEKQDVHNELPVPKPGWYSFLRFTALNTYRRLFSLVVVGNVVAFVIIMVRGAVLLDLVNAAAINLCVCGLARQPLVVNFLFMAACKVPRSAPIRIRTLAAKIFHFGGVHSGCGIASALWYIAFVGVLTYDYAHSTIPAGGAYAAVVVLAYLIMALLGAIIISAYPAIRFKFHDYFEAVHRFSGWSVILLFWALLLTFASQQPPSMGVFLINQPSFWIIILLTIAVVHPWVMLRKVKVTAEVLSTHATRLHFDHQYTKFGQGLSISRHPLKDWHSFASFPDRFDTPEHKFSLVVSKAGDFTGDLIANPPTHIWKRAVPVRGFGYVMKLYHRMILVTTGSGIGPCLSYLADDDRPAMRIIWQTRNPKKTYGDRLINLVHQMDPDPIILDTSAGGRIDMLPYVIKQYKKFDAEAVCIISNPIMTKRLVFELERRGILAMGPIFDS